MECKVTVSDYTVGTLVYSRTGLAILFSWMLWGSFVFTIMELVLPTLLPILLKQNGASNTSIAFITSSIYMLANMFFNPIISYRSDRYRSRWGRRRPFILWSTPGVVVFLAAIPFAPEMFALLSKSSTTSSILAYSPISPVIVIFGLLVAGFQVFNMFVSSVYYYLIPDVVPYSVLGRFNGMFRIACALAGMSYSYFIFGYADHHMQFIFVGSAVVYGIVITLMCLNVKEGEYPPPPPEDSGHWSIGIKNYFNECFGKSYFWLVFLAYSCLGWGSRSTNFLVFYLCDQRELSLDSYGKFGVLANAVMLLAAYPSAILVDRFGSHRLFIASQLAIGLSCLVVFWGGHSSLFVILSLILVYHVFNSLFFVAVAKWTVDVYPKERYGQFASAGAMFSSVIGITLSVLCGWMLDCVKDYKYLFIWYSFFALIGVFFAVMVYRPKATVNS